MTSRIAKPVLGLLAVALAATADEGWDAREARGVRQAIYPAIDDIPDFAQVKAAFDKGLSGDETAAQALVALVGHVNQDVASTAAQMLGRFPSPSNASALKKAYSTEPRVLVRAGALAGLARMKDPDTRRLATEALSGDDEWMRGAAIGALVAMANRADAPLILQYLNRHPDELDAELLKWLGEMGDSPESTAVRNKLLLEVNNKNESFALRYSAALGLQAMGLASLAQPIIDIQKAEDTLRAMTVLKDSMEVRAATRGPSVKSQADVDMLLSLADVEGARYKKDSWGHSYRARFVAQGVLQVISDGPDLAAGTIDDLSSAEPWSAYVYRAYPDQFLP